MATCYFQDLAASDYAWTTVANWWTDAACTVAKGSLPIAGDTIYIAGPMNSGPAATIAFAHIYVADVNTGGGGFTVDFTNATGPATFDQSSANYGTITGNCTFDGGSYNGGTVNGDVYGTNGGTVNGDVYGTNGGTVSGDVYGTNGGTVSGTVYGTNAGPMAVCAYLIGTNDAGSVFSSGTFNAGDYNSGLVWVGHFGIGSHNRGAFVEAYFPPNAALTDASNCTAQIIGAFAAVSLSFTVDYPRTDILGTGLL